MNEQITIFGLQIYKLAIYIDFFPHEFSRFPQLKGSCWPVGWFYIDWLWFLIEIEWSENL